MLRLTPRPTCVLEAPTACRAPLQSLVLLFVLQASTVQKDPHTLPQLHPASSLPLLDLFQLLIVIQVSSHCGTSRSPACHVQMEWSALVQEHTGHRSVLLELLELLGRQMFVKHARLGLSQWIEVSRTLLSAMCALKGEFANHMEFTISHHRLHVPAGKFVDRELDFEIPMSVQKVSTVSQAKVSQK